MAFKAQQSAHTHSGDANLLELPAEPTMKHKLSYVDVAGDLQGSAWNALLEIVDNDITVYQVPVSFPVAGQVLRIEFPEGGLISVMPNKVMKVRLTTGYGNRTSYLNIGYATGLF